MALCDISLWLCSASGAANIVMCRDRLERQPEQPPGAIGPARFPERRNTTTSRRDCLERPPGATGKATGKATGNAAVFSDRAARFPGPSRPHHPLGGPSASPGRGVVASSASPTAAASATAAVSAAASSPASGPVSGPVSAPALAGLPGTHHLAASRFSCAPGTARVLSTEISTERAMMPAVAARASSVEITLPPNQALTIIFTPTSTSTSDRPYFR